MGTGFWWRLKAKLTGSSIADTVISADELAIDDAKIADRIEGYQTDEIKIDNFRKEHSHSLLQLNKITDRSDKRQDEKLNGALDNNLKKYERELKKEIADIQRIIELASKIVANEHLSILYDIRRPRRLFVHYKKKLKLNLKDVIIDEKTKSDIVNFMDNIQQEYDLVIKYTIDLCSQMQRVGPDNLKDSGNLTEAMQERARIKKQLGGRALVLIYHINSLEKYFVTLRRNKVLSLEDANTILGNIQKFRDNFRQLSDYSKRRMEGSETLIKECVLLQKRKIEELEHLNDEISKVTPNLAPNSRAILSRCKAIINAVEREDNKLIYDEQATERATVSSLASDESRLYSESPVNTQTVGSHTVLDSIRKKTKAIAFILLGTFAVSLGAPTIQVIRCDENKGEKILLVGTPVDVERYVAEQNLDISPALINSETQVIVSETNTYHISENTLFNFSTHFTNEEGATDSAALARTIAQNIQKSIQDINSRAKASLYRQLKDAKMSKEEKERLCKDAAVIDIEFVSKESSINGFTDPLGLIIGRTATNNNQILSLLRAKSALSIIMDVVNNIQKNSQFHVNMESVSQIPVTGKGAILKHAKVHIVANRLNEFVKKVNPELMNRFFGFQEYIKYADYNNKDKLQINYDKLSTGDEIELLKFDLAARLLKAVNPAEYEKNVKDYMKELRKVEIKLTFKANVKVFGSGKTLIVTMNPVADLPIREHVPYHSESDYFVPKTIGKPNKMQNNVFVKGARLEAGDFRRGPASRKIFSKQKQKANR